ncbi:hypothetical protein T484DRAFT_1813973 [Baffinella frigidus]|nr:hypothetical protein T484DRAFT_1813973 [Cryptophyta sp. CCMP2293]
MGSAEPDDELKGTKTSIVVRRLQDELPLARVVYVSATGASETEHFNGGTGAMELLAMQMKREGKYLVRSLSFKGASFDVEEMQMTNEQV